MYLGEIENEKKKGMASCITRIAICTKENGKKMQETDMGSCFILMEGTIKGFGEMIKETDKAKILIIIKSLR